MNETLKQIAIGVAGGLVVLLIIAIWGWLSGGGLIVVLGGATQTALTELEDSIGRGKCTWVAVGYDKSHRHEAGEWCSEGSFIKQVDIDGCPQGPENCPVIGQVLCCDVLP